ncbi:hypothetical protein [Lactiplantibacillus plantarum]|uniref:hypothetical protein n=1 Tax=Lactiplantibacillus plantarum TaxID=1590 RepID=UPI001BA6B134|nr:hypothetical protein [Lactiplantibacillus plantarum]MBS0936619.1 hypothetical protein [Lactiplantibacillus plantarum]MBS0943800.1 hypothetical protein [Lactiplantibacillus plantarum]
MNHIFFLIRAVILVFLTIAFWIWVIRGLSRRHRKFVKKHLELVPIPEEKVAAEAKRKKDRARREHIRHLDGVMMDSVQQHYFADISGLNYVFEKLYPNNHASVYPYGRQEVDLKFANPGKGQSSGYRLTIMNASYGPTIAINDCAVNGGDQLVDFIDGGNS